MKNKVNITVKQPCLENFNSFKKTTTGGFCNSCQKEVIDFSKMTSNEIISYFKQNTNNTCGQFKKEQLVTLSNKNHSKRKLSFLGGIGLACLSFFSMGIMHAQQKPVKKQIKQDNNAITVEGIISDISGGLPGVSILLEGTSKGTETDINGRFKFPKQLKNGDILICSYLGYETKKIVINNKTNKAILNLNINFKESSYMLMGIVDVRQVYKSKKKS